MTSDSTLRLRSIYTAESPDESWRWSGTAVSPDDFIPDDNEVQSGAHSGEDADSPPAAGAGANILSRSSNDAGDPEPLQLPRSTHSLLFTQPICSVSFAFSAGIAIMSIVCLGLAFWNNMDLANAPFYEIPNVPVNVHRTVQLAQYFGIFIVLLMEEEIPTGIHLLRMIPRPTFEEQFPDLNYRRFIFSSVLRIVMGYLFLFNVFVVLAQATEVIDIFYDVLALQFIQQLDDIAFALAKLDVLGKGMKRACTAACFQAEFERKKSGRSLRSKRSSIFLKALYLVNLVVSLAKMATISAEQRSGNYQVESITVDFGNVIWENPLVKMPSEFYEKWIWLYPWYNNVATHDVSQWTLLFSYFNGVYKQERGVTCAGRPVYKEMRKFDGSKFDLITPAKIYYCKGISAWVFAHEYIKKSKAADEKGCNWLLRSEETEEYDLMNVDMNWRVWNGVIGKAEISYADNECSEDTDCNLNGRCSDGKCNCIKEVGVEYFGSHCETSLRDECQTIIGERNNETFSVIKYPSSGIPNDPADTLYKQYSRPNYFYDRGFPELDSLGFSLTLTYTGNRWFGTAAPQPQDIISAFNLTEKQLVLGSLESHALWGRSFDPVFTVIVSDETKKDTPVGVDFYYVEKQGGQFGPFGALNPLQLHNQTGRGFFRCGGPLSSSGNVSASGRRLQFPNILGNDWP